MRKLIFLGLITIFLSCSNEQPKDQNTAVFIEEQLKDFIKLNPDWANDEKIEVETTDKFRHRFINLSNEPDFLKNMPLQLKEIIDTAINEHTLKIARFKAFNDKNRPVNSLLNTMQIEISGVISAEQGSSLSIGKNYILTGNLYKQGKRADIKFIHVADFKGYDLGKYTFTITSFKNIGQ